MEFTASAGGYLLLQCTLHGRCSRTGCSRSTSSLSGSCLPSRHGFARRPHTCRCRRCLAGGAHAQCKQPYSMLLNVLLARHQRIGLPLWVDRDLGSHRVVAVCTGRGLLSPARSTEVSCSKPDVSFWKLAVPKVVELLSGTICSDSQTEGKAQTAT